MGAEIGELLVVVLSYLLGSISFSYLISRRLAGVDIREHGSGNAGATNTLRVLGVGPALLVLVLDVLKGVVAVFLAAWVSGGEPLWMILAGVAAVIGHNWPVFFGFKGGKGVATTIGVVMVLYPWPAIVAGVAAICLIALIRYVSLGSLVFVALMPLLIYLSSHFNLINYPIHYVYGAVAMLLLSVIRHRSNLVRLVKGEENKLGGDK